MNIDRYKNKTILLFGQPRAFNKEEFESQLQVHQINIVYEFQESVSLVIDGKMMTPYEEIESEKIYNLNKYDFVEIDIFESALASCLDEDTLLMSLKLSADKARLKTFIQNGKISDILFFKVLKMYNWGDDDFFENDDNRDVSSAFILRFYENIERNHNVQYATTGFVHLIKQSKNAALLDVILSLKPIKHNPKMKMQLAQNEFSSSKIQAKLKQDENYEVKQALCFNANLDIKIIKEFLKDEKLGANIAKNIKLNEELFTLLSTQKTALALNESLSLDMQEQLLNLKNKDVDYALSLNENISSKTLKILLKLQDENIKTALYENKQMPKEFLQEAYDNNLYVEQLAKNENTSIEILYQLHLDSRYERFVKQNESFAKNIQQHNIGWL